VEAEATHIPESVTVNVEGFAEGTQVRASDIALPDGSTLVSVAEMLILTVQQPPKAEEAAPAASEEGDAAASAESSDESSGSGGDDAGGE